MPKTKLGKWAGGLLAVFLLLLIALILGMKLLGILPGTLLARIVGICMMIAGIATFVTAVVSLVKFKDRSFVVILATIIGIIAMLAVVMEVVEGLNSLKLK
jgi:hypothetical protein